MAVRKLMFKRSLLLALALALVASLAQANPGGGRFAQREMIRQNFQQPPQQPNFQREAPQQFQRRNEGNSGDAQRPQRFSPEERRQLRRDVQDAGRDIYQRRR